MDFEFLPEFTAAGDPAAATAPGRICTCVLLSRPPELRRGRPLPSIDQRQPDSRPAEHSLRGSTDTQQRIQQALLRSVGHLQSCARGPTAATFLARPVTPACTGPWTSVYYERFRRAIRASTAARRSTSRRSTRTRRGATSRRSQRRPARTTRRPRLPTGPSADSTAAPTRIVALDRGANPVHRAAGRRRLQLSERSSQPPPAPTPQCANADQYCVFDTPASVLATTVLLHDFVGAVLPEQGRRRIRAFRPAAIAGMRRRTGTCASAPARRQGSIRSHSRAIDVKSTGFLVNGVAAANPSGRTYAQEMANFAKWYAFYRSRILAMKTAGGIAFSALTDENSRVGLHTLFDRPDLNNLFLNVKPFDVDAEGGLVHQVLLRAYRAGTRRCRRRSSASASTSRIRAVGTARCGRSRRTRPPAGARRTIHLLSTDGYWNRAVDRRRFGDRTATVPPTLPGTIPGFTPGSPFPRPYYEGRRDEHATASPTSRCTTG